MDVARLREHGLSTSQAEWEAGRRFGRMGSEAEQAREGWGVSLLEDSDRRNAALAHLWRCLLSLRA